jgi:ABC-type multidrug transport system fused ATPase/permease subunit
MIILDEPTSSIDATSEYKIFNQIYDYIEDKTVIIISHRFSTVRNAEKIFVLKEGEIVERGSHKELMSQKGIYEEAYNLQAEGYN